MIDRPTLADSKAEPDSNGEHAEPVTTAKHGQDSRAVPAVEAGSPAQQEGHKDLSIHDADATQPDEHDNGTAASRRSYERQAIDKPVKSSDLTVSFMKVKAAH